MSKTLKWILITVAILLVALVVLSKTGAFGKDEGKPIDYPIWCAMYDSMGTLGILSAGATANKNFYI